MPVLTVLHTLDFNLSLCNCGSFAVRGVAQALTLIWGLGFCPLLTKSSTMGVYSKPITLAEAASEVATVENSKYLGATGASPSGNLIQDFYRGGVILVTGATGFVGKALVEKLLRSCPDIDVVYLLMRPKKGQDVATRYRQLLTNPVFDRLRSECGAHILDKTRPIAGDVSEPGLGLSPADRRRLISEVDIVFHSAATVRFDEGLREAVILNVKGTRTVIELTKEMPKLKALVHVSTAYSNADKRIIDETVYAPPADPEAIIRLCRDLDDDVLGAVSKGLLGGRHPNTYTFTKALAEWVVQEEAAGLPCAIVRPSIVTAAWREPVPGWVDNVSGITGIMLEIGRGAIRSIICKQEFVVDLIPVDIVVNTLIVTAWRTATNRSNAVVVYNCTTGETNPVRWYDYGRMTHRTAVSSPTRYVQWYPDFSFRTNRVVHAAVEVLCHFAPAFLFDVMLRAQGEKPMMMKIAKRTQKAAQTGEFFSLHEWTFHGENTRTLLKDLSISDDRDLFDFNVASMQWEPYVRIYMAGIRKFILKDNAETMEAARKKVNRLYWANKVTQFLSLALLARAARSFGTALIQSLAVKEVPR